MKKLTTIFLSSLLTVCCTTNAFSGIAREPKKTTTTTTTSQPNMQISQTSKMSQTAFARAGTQQTVAPKISGKNTNIAKKQNEDSSCLTQDGCLIVVKIVDNNIEYSFVDFNHNESDTNK